MVIREQGAGPGLGEERRAAVESAGAAVQERDDPAGERGDGCALCGEIDVDPQDHSDAGGGSGAGTDGDRAPVCVVREEPLEAGVRPAPEVNRVRMVDLD